MDKELTPEEIIAEWKRLDRLPIEEVLWLEDGEVQGPVCEIAKQTVFRSGGYRSEIEPYIDRYRVKLKEWGKMPDG